MPTDSAAPTQKAKPKTPNTLHAVIDPEYLRGLQQGLISWYIAHGRDLPWRRTQDPYAILVSETLLQQTQVATAQPVYEAVLQRWPTFAAMAAAPVEEV